MSSVCVSTTVLAMAVATTELASATWAIEELIAPCGHARMTAANKVFADTENAFAMLTTLGTIAPFRDALLIVMIEDTA